MDKGRVQALADRLKGMSSLMSYNDVKLIPPTDRPALDPVECGVEMVISFVGDPGAEKQIQDAREFCFAGQGVPEKGNSTFSEKDATDFVLRYGPGVLWFVQESFSATIVELASFNKLGKIEKRFGEKSASIDALLSDVVGVLENLRAAYQDLQRNVPSQVGDLTLGGQHPVKEASHEEEGVEFPGIV